MTFSDVKVSDQIIVPVVEKKICSLQNLCFDILCPHFKRVLHLDLLYDKGRKVRASVSCEHIF